MMADATNWIDVTLVIYHYRVALPQLFTLSQIGVPSLKGVYKLTVRKLQQDKSGQPENLNT